MTNEKAKIYIKNLKSDGELGIIKLSENEIEALGVALNLLKNIEEIKETAYNEGYDAGWTA